MNLIELLMDNLNINNKQAMGGAGLIFKLAKEKLADSDFQALSAHIEGLDEIIGSAPKQGGLLGALGNIAAGIGGENNRVAIIATLTSGFTKLNLDSSQIMGFISVIDSYLREKGDETVNSVLNKLSREIG